MRNETRERIKKIETGRFQEIKGMIAAKLKLEHAKDLSDSEIERCFDMTIAPRFCKEAAKYLRDTGHIQHCSLDSIFYPGHEEHTELDDYCGNCVHGKLISLLEIDCQNPNDPLGHVAISSSCENFKPRKIN